MKEFRAEADEFGRGFGFFDPYPPLREKINAARVKFKGLKQPHAGIVRLVGLPTAQQAPVAAATLTRCAKELGRGALVTAESGRTRVRTDDV